MNSTVAYVSFGSNQGDRLRAIRDAIDLISADQLTISVTISGMIETEPVGMAPETPSFLNGVVCVHTNADLHYFFNGLREIEKHLGRRSKGDYQSRSIDLDVIFFGDQVMVSEDLTVPHPRYRFRSFVLDPLLELAPNLIDPETRRLVSDYRAVIF